VDSAFDDPHGVPISAIILGGRRMNDVPLVYQSVNWSSEVYLGATLSSERTAAAEGQLGELRADPMAMLPFCGYHMGDYFRHYIKMGKNLSEAPRIFHVNWFRKNEKGQFMWPGFSDNMRVLKWIVERVRGRVRSKESPIGWLPKYEDMDWSGLDFSREQWDALMHYDRERFKEMVLEYERFFIRLYERMPKELLYERELLLCRL